MALVAATRRTMARAAAAAASTPLFLGLVRNPFLSFLADSHPLSLVTDLTNSCAFLLFFDLVSLSLSIYMSIGLFVCLSSPLSVSLSILPSFSLSPSAPLSFSLFLLSVRSLFFCHPSASSLSMFSLRLYFSRDSLFLWHPVPQPSISILLFLSRFVLWRSLRLSLSVFAVSLGGSLLFRKVSFSFLVLALVLTS